MGADAESDILQTYRGYRLWKIRAFSDPSRQVGGDLSSYASGSALEGALSELASLAGSGTMLVGQPMLDPVISDVADGSATITDCLDSSTWQQVNASGEPVGAASGGPRAVAVATMAITDGRWLVDTFAVEPDRTC